MGLLDFLSNNDPQGAGQLAFGASMLDAGGPQSRPVSVGQALGQSIMGGRNAALLQDMNNRRNALSDMQVLQALSQIADLQQRQALVADFARRFQGGGAPAQAAPAMPSIGPMTPDTAGSLGGQMRLGRLAGIQQQQSQQPAPQQGGFPLDANAVALAKLAGIGDFTDLYKYQSTPQERKAGSFYDSPSTGRREYIPDVKQDSSGRTSVINMGPDGQFRVSIPQGALDAAGAYATQGKTIDAAFTPQAIKGAQGEPRIAPLLSVLYPNGMPPNVSVPYPTTPAAQPKQPASDTAGLPPALFNEYRALLKQSMEAGPAGVPPAVSSRMAELEAALSGGQTQKQTPAAQASGPGMQTGPTAATEQTFKDRDTSNKVFIEKTLPEVNASANTAGSMISNVQIARNALRNSGSGWGTDAKATAANVLLGLGLPSQSVGNFASNAQVFQQVASTRLWEVLNTAKGPQTEGDAQRARATFAQLSNTPQANEYILDLAEAAAERDKLKAAFFTKAMPIAQGKGDPLNTIEQEWRDQAPSIFRMPSMKKWAK